MHIMLSEWYLTCCPGVLRILLHSVCGLACGTDGLCCYFLLRFRQLQEWKVWAVAQIRINIHSKCVCVTLPFFFPLSGSQEVHKSWQKNESSDICQCCWGSHGFAHPGPLKQPSCSLHGFNRDLSPYRAVSSCYNCLRYADLLCPWCTWTPFEVSESHGGMKLWKKWIPSQVWGRCFAFLSWAMVWLSCLEFTAVTFGSFNLIHRR